MIISRKYLRSEELRGSWIWQLPRHMTSLKATDKVLVSPNVSRNVCQVGQILKTQYNCSLHEICDFRWVLFSWASQKVKICICYCMYYSLLKYLFYLICVSYLGENNYLVKWKFWNVMNQPGPWRGVLKEEAFESSETNDLTSNHGSKLVAYALLETAFQIALSIFCSRQFSKQFSFAILKSLFIAHILQIKSQG